MMMVIHFCDSSPQNFNDLPELDAIEESEGGLEHDSMAEIESENDIEMETGSGNTPQVGSEGGDQKGPAVASGGRSCR